MLISGLVGTPPFLKTTAAFLFSLSALSPIHIFVKKYGLCPYTHLGVWLCTFWVYNLLLLSVYNHGPKCVLSDNNMCLGFTKYILIGHLGRHEKHGPKCVWVTKICVLASIGEKRGGRQDLYLCWSARLWTKCTTWG